MELVLSIAKFIDAPGSLLFLALSVALGLFIIYVWPRHRTLGRRWLLAVIAVYVVLATPWTASAIVNRLPPGPSRSSSWGAIETLVVLDGDNRLGRVREAAAVFSSSRPRAVWLVGNPLMLERLQRAGIPRSQLRPDEDTLTTRDQLAHVRALTSEKANGRVALIASRVQMPRIAALISARNIPVVLIPSPIDAEPPTAGVWRFVPSYGSLCASRDALYEHAALVYYRWRGWIP